MALTKDLRDKFAGFNQASVSFAGKIKNEGKWTKELDEDFAQKAAKYGVDSALVDYVKQNGGFRDSYQKTLGTTGQLKNHLDNEVKLFENLQSKNASQRSGFGKNNFTQTPFKPAAAAFLSCKSPVVKAVVYFVGMGQWVFTFGNLHDRDNLRDIPSILKTLSHQNNSNLSIPLNSLSNQSSPIKWLPAIGYSYIHVHQFGAFLPEISKLKQLPNQLEKPHRRNRNGNS